MAEIFINPQSSIILAEGHGRFFRFSWKTISLGILIGVVVLFGIFALALARNLPIPQETVFLAFLSADEARELPETIRHAFPKDWKAYIDQSSRWPVLFGVYRQEDHWYTFAASPSWAVPKTDKLHLTKAGLITFAADTEIGQTWGKSYLGFLERRGFGSPRLAVDIDRFFGATSTDPRSWTWMRFDGGLIRTDKRFPAASSANIPAADVSLRLEPGDGKDALAAAIPDLPDAERLQRLPPMSEVAIRYGEYGPSLVRLSFEQILNEEDASALLGAYGFTMRRPVMLPDGTVSYERIEPVATSGTSLLGERKDERGRMAEISGQVFSLHDVSSTGELPLSPSCANGNPWLRLSREAVSAVLKRFDLNLEPEDVKAMQLVSEEGYLAACFE